MRDFMVQRSINGEVRTLRIRAINGPTAIRLADEAAQRHRTKGR